MGSRQRSKLSSQTNSSKLMKSATLGDCCEPSGSGGTSMNLESKRKLEKSSSSSPRRAGVLLCSPKSVKTRSISFTRQGRYIYFSAQSILGVFMSLISSSRVISYFWFLPHCLVFSFAPHRRRRRTKKNLFFFLLLSIVILISFSPFFSSA